MISSKYDWLYKEKDLPKMVQEGLRIGRLDTSEVKGQGYNPNIIELAIRAGVYDIYKSDEIAWCAVAQTAIAIAAGKEVPFTSWDRLRAKSFLKFGTPVDIPMMGDTLVFTRDGGGHVGIYIGEDPECYHVMGGNQSDQYNIVRIKKNRLSGARRPHYNNQPASVKRVYLKAEGAPSANEA
jgi:uncharacterized protein (TIGR02594 family)